jgi:hypothetical protein
MRLGDLLVGQGLATPADIETAVARQQREGGRIGTHLVAMGVLTVEQLLTTLRGQNQGEIAVDLAETTLRRILSVSGPNHANSFRARYNLARALLVSGRSGDAAEHAERALVGHMTLLGRDHAWTLDSAQLVVDIRQAIARGRVEQPAAAPAA